MIFVFIALYIATYHAPDGLIYGLCVEGVVISLVLSAFLKTDYRKSKEKSGWFCVFLYAIANIACFTWFDESAPLSGEMFGWQSMFFTGMYLYSKYRSYDIGTDEYNPNDVFIVFKRPRNFIDYLISFIFKPVSSVSIVVAGEKYGFKRGSSFSRTSYRKKDYHSYIKIDLKPSAVRKIMLLSVGENWKPCKNCCHVIQRIFPSYKFGVLDFLPSHMAKTILQIRGL